MSTQVHKVVAFVTRDDGSTLFFQHPEAGYQLPAGTVDEGETGEVAVLRELWEETSLDQVEIVAYLGRVPTPATQAMMRENVRPLLSIHDKNSASPRMLSRNYRVEVLDEVDEMARIVYREVKFHPPSGDESAVWETKFTVEGWVPKTSLVRNVQRDIFHIRTLKPTAETWEHAGDHGFMFRMFWHPFGKNPGLHPLQAVWFDYALEKLSPPR